MFTKIFGKQVDFHIICVTDMFSSAFHAKFADLASSDRQSEHFLKKINRARFALARTDSIRSVSGSIFAKPPYRRAASVPMHLMTRTQPPMKGIYSYFHALLCVVSCTFSDSTVCWVICEILLTVRLKIITKITDRSSFTRLLSASQVVRK